MALTIIIESAGATTAQLITKFTEIKNKLSRPDPTNAVIEVAKLWSISYKGEGSAVGGWVQLAQHTIDERARLGFSAGPILIRQGSLESMTTAFFVQGREGSASSVTNYGKQSIATHASLSIANGTATLGVSGPKTVHQYGSKNIPARPFWFTDRNVILAARLGVINWIKKEVTE